MVRLICKHTCEDPAPATHWRPLVRVIIDAVRSSFHSNASHVIKTLSSLVVIKIKISSVLHLTIELCGTGAP